jgi:hypothetical protein
VLWRKQMTITEIHNLKQLDIIQKLDRDGYIHVGMIVNVTPSCGSFMFQIMFEDVDSGVIIRNYSSYNVMEFNKV